MSPRVPSRHPALLPVTLSAPTHVEEAYRNFVNIGEAYFTGGAEPRLDGTSYIAAWPALLNYVHTHKDALASRGVVESELAAGARLCSELADCLDRLPSSPAPSSGRHVQVVVDAVLRLERMRGAVRRMAPGSDSARILASFGVAVPLDPARPAQIADAIALFLEGAHQNLDRLHLFRFVTADLEELKEQRRALLSLYQAGDRPGESNFARADRLLAALMAFYASMATAISQAFPDDDPRRIEGLCKIPRARERRRC